jgi:uncharacterized membrane protein YjgN (DUF898 family)
MTESPTPSYPPPAEPGTPWPYSAPPAAERPALGFAFTGSGSDYFVLQLVNGLLTMVTLGFFYPWARVRQLKFLIGSLRLGDDALTFHGEGRELFWGVLRAWILFVIPIFLLATFMNWPGLDFGTRVLLLVAFYFLLFVFVSYGLMGSLRYRASRTTWRGIRLGFDGRFADFGANYGLRLLLVVATFGIAYPFASTWRREFVMTHTRLGGESLGFDGQANDLFGTYVLCWFLFIPTFGLSMSWFHGHQQAYFWNHTTFADGRFHTSLTGGEWVGIALVNSLLILFTLGFGAPWAFTNMHREFFSRLSLRDADLTRVTAAPSEGSALGEGAVDLTDSADTGFDV